MKTAAAAKAALCICTGALVGAGVNEARHTEKPSVSRTKSAGKPSRKVVQFPCEPFIVQDQMSRDAMLKADFEAPLAPLTIGETGGQKVGPTLRRPPVDVPEPAAIGLLGLGLAGLLGLRRALALRP